MKKILVLRHATAEYKQNTIDHDRKLTSSGYCDSKIIGKYLAKINNIPDLVITSSAIRALSTAQNAMSSGSWKSTLKINPTIYGGGPKSLLYLLAEQNDKYNSICLVGHEPNFSAFIAEMTDGIYRVLETCNIALIELKINSWSEIQFNKGILSWLIKPESLK